MWRRGRKFGTYKWSYRWSEVDNGEIRREFQKGEKRKVDKNKGWRKERKFGSYKWRRKGGMKWRMWK